MFAYATRAFALTASALAIMTAAAIVSPAHAADSDTTSTMVHYRDLNLATETGAAVLKRRIANAAADVCGPVYGRTLDDRARFDACRDTAIASASPQMDAVIASARSSDHRYAMNNDVIAMLGR